MADMADSVVVELATVRACPPGLRVRGGIRCKLCAFATILDFFKFLRVLSEFLHCEGEAYAYLHLHPELSHGVLTCARVRSSDLDAGIEGLRVECPPDTEVRLGPASSSCNC